MASTKPNIYGKLAEARGSFHKLSLVKTGRNKFAGYDYFELGDFLIPAMQCLDEQGLVPVVSFSDDTAIMRVYSNEGTESDFIEIRSPMREANLKGCHPIQNLGAVETYQRRYLWVALMEIVEHDALDAAPLDADEEQPVKKTATKKKVATKKAVEEEDVFNTETSIDDEETAILAANKLINLAKEMHSDSLDSLTSFWKANLPTLNQLGAEYPDHFDRVKSAFTLLRKRVKE